MFCLALACQCMCYGQQLSHVIYFDTDRAQINEQYVEELQILISEVDVEQIESIELVGFADYRGTPEYNLVLSQRRTDAVANYLHTAYPDINAPISQKAVGELVENDNIKDDRRVELNISIKQEIKKLSGSFAPSEIPITELERGNLLRIKGLNFKRGLHILLPSSIPHLKDLESLLLEYPNLELEIQGHVCCPDQFKEGEDGFNTDTKTNNLSLTRARNIYEYLVRKGIKADRLSYKGIGSSAPLVYPEMSEADRIQNRRVELLITNI